MPKIVILGNAVKQRRVPVCYQWMAENAEIFEASIVWDIGCGPKAFWYEWLKERLPATCYLGLMDKAYGNAYDQASYKSPWLCPFATQVRPNWIVMSNVVNCQETSFEVKKLIHDSLCLAQDGVIFNYPASPRYSSVSKPEIDAILSEVAWHVDYIPGRKMWVCFP